LERRVSRARLVVTYYVSARFLVSAGAETSALGLSPQTQPPSAMAIYHLSLKTASKGKGRSAGAHARYIEREGKYAKSRINETLEYQSSGNMPKWAEGNELAFWDASDLNERANGRVYSELEIALPREFSKEERERLVSDFIKRELKGHPYTVAIHNKKALDGGEQPHAHIMFSERQLDGVERSREQFFKRANDKNPALGGTKKNRDWNRREKVDEVRLSWERAINKALERNGIDQQVDRRTLEAQGIDRVPEPKMGPERTQMLREGKGTEVSDQVVELRQYRAERWAVRKLEEELKVERARVYHFGEVLRRGELEGTFTLKRAGAAREVSEGERKKYQRVLDLVFTKVERENGDTEYQWSRSGRAAFVDHGDRISFSNTSETSVKAALQLAKQKGWEGANVSGDEEFRREAWIQGQLLGIGITGYTGTKADELEVGRRREELLQKKQQYREKEQVRGPTEPVKERKKREAATTWVPVSVVIKGLEKHIEKDFSEYRAASEEMSKLTKYPSYFNEREARRVAEEEAYTGRLEAATTELSQAEKLRNQAEKAYRQFNKEKGIWVYLPGNAREDKALFKAWCAASKTYDDKFRAKEYILREIKQPRTVERVERRVREMLAEYREQESTRKVLSTTMALINITIGPYRATIERLENFRDREIQVPVKGNKEKQIRLPDLNDQLSKMEHERDKKRSKGKGLGLER